ncbi:hypothetical protein V6N11_082293 [Hibiscus sabdariffa]|uniref:Uncharacterized protein n=2 Tax=Hibiscus sabdariffa TaxID=183260 RepID=A0ABR2AG85_9ROSI
MLVPLNTLHTELLGLYEGLQLAWYLSIERPIAQPDSLEPVKMVNDPHANVSHLPLVRAINSLVKKCLITNIIWIPQECNMVADGLAKLTAHDHYQPSIFDSPQEVLNLITRNVTGLTIS